MLTVCEQTGSLNDMSPYGVGNHGGGPTREHIEFGRAMAKRELGPTVKFSTARAFFDSVLKQNPRCRRSRTS
jgi:hypothetical protein